MQPIPKTIAAPVLRRSDAKGHFFTTGTDEGGKLDAGPPLSTARRLIGAT